VRAFGTALGEFLAGQDLRVTLVGSGGLSHDPPTPRIDHSKPEATERLVVGKGPCLPPSEQWDRDFLGTFLSAKLEDFDRMTDAEIDRVAGFGAHEVRTWVAAAAAAKAMGQLHNELKYYHLVPEWITGMGIVVGQA
jgi:2,3-dihydroxyphenylpropionate 1,2-dioxygenase